MLLQKNNKYFNKKDNLAKLETILSQENYLEVLERVFLIKVGDLNLEISALDCSFDRKDRQLIPIKEEELKAVKRAYAAFIGQRKEIEKLAKRQAELEDPDTEDL